MVDILDVLEAAPPFSFAVVPPAPSGGSSLVVISAPGQGPSDDDRIKAYPTYSVDQAVPH
jgi:hypothetical protein